MKFKFLIFFLLLFFFQNISSAIDYGNYLAGRYALSKKDYEEAIIFLEQASDINNIHEKSKEYDLLYENASKEINDSIRYTLYNKMDELIMKEAAIVPLYYDQVLRFSQPNISGFNSNAMNLLDLKKVEKTNVTNNQ